MILVDRYRIYPTDEQITAMQSLMERMRLLYNAALQQRREAWERVTVSHSDSRGRRKGASLSFFDQAKGLTELRESDPEWASLNVAMSRDPLDRVHKAFDAFFRRCKAGQTPGYPRFHAKGTYKSLSFPLIGSYRLSDRLRVPNVPGTIEMVRHRQLSGTPCEAKVTSEAGQWFVSVVCKDCPLPAPLPPTNHVIGVDLGVSCFAATSDGDMIDNPRHAANAAKRLTRAQRKLAAKDARIKRARQRRSGADAPPEKLTRDERNSSKRQMLVQRVQRAHVDTQRARSDFHHKTALHLLRGADLIAVEDLKVSNMTRSAKGTAEEPGKNVKQKSGLNRAILDVAPSAFVTTLESKATKYGRNVVRVDPKNTSQDCSGCGVKVPKALSDRVHKCPHCGLVLDRDVNAARNILKRAGNR